MITKISSLLFDTCKRQVGKEEEKIDRFYAALKTIDFLIVAKSLLLFISPFINNISIVITFHGSC